MLARVAERIFWLARYLERAENTARLINVYSKLLLDLPRGTKIGWESLIDIIGNRAVFDSIYSEPNEQNVTKFLLTDSRNLSSIFSTIELARENARTTREILPSATWERINGLHLRAREIEGARLSRSATTALMQDLIEQSQILTGVLSGSMSHNHAYDFMRMGRMLERADMTTRIVDAGTGALFKNEDVELHPEAPGLPDTYDSILWMSVLKSLSAYQMYRQYSLDKVEGSEVVSFLIKDAFFPRSVTHCLMDIEHCLPKLPRSDEVLRAILATRRNTDNLDVRAMSKLALHNFMDELQIEFSGIYEAIASTWFNPGIEPPK